MRYKERVRSIKSDIESALQKPECIREIKSFMDEEFIYTYLMETTLEELEQIENILIKYHSRIDTLGANEMGELFIKTKVI